MLLNTWLISPTPHQVSDLLYLLTPGFGICHSVTPFSSNVRKNFFKRGQLLDCLCILILLLPFIHFLVNKWIATSTLLVHSHIHVCVCVWKLLIKNFLLFFSLKKMFNVACFNQIYHVLCRWWWKKERKTWKWNIPLNKKENDHLFHFGFV